MMWTKNNKKNKKKIRANKFNKLTYSNIYIKQWNYRIQIQINERKV